MERFALPIHIEPRNDHAQTTVRKFISDVNEFVIEKLTFINSDHPSFGRKVPVNFGCVVDNGRRKEGAIVARDVVFAVAFVDARPWLLKTSRT